MRAYCMDFWDDETGASAVDWVVLTAAVVALALVSIALFSASIRDNGREASAIMTTYEIDSEFDTEADMAALQNAANAAVAAQAAATP